MTHFVKVFLAAALAISEPAATQTVEWSQVGGSLQGNSDLIGIVGQGYSTPPASSDGIELQSGFLANPMFAFLPNLSIFSLGPDTLKTYGAPSLDLSSRMMAGSSIETNAPSILGVLGSTIQFLQVGSATLTVIEPNADTVRNTVRIVPKPITVTSLDAFKSAGSVDPKLVYQAIGLVGSDTLRGALERAPGESPGEYQIRQGTLDAGSNYILSFTGSKLRIATTASIGTRSMPGHLTSHELSVSATLPLIGKATNRSNARIGFSIPEQTCAACQSIDLLVDAPGDVEIAIFDRIGTPVLHWSGSFGRQELSRMPRNVDGRHRAAVEWNLRSASGAPVSAGVYLWKIKLATTDGQKVETVLKLGVR